MSRKKTGLINDTVRNIGGAVKGAVTGAVKGIDDYATGTNAKGQPVMSAPIMAPLTAAVGAIRGGYLGAKGQYSAPKTKNFTSSDYVSAPVDKARNANRVTGSGPAMSNPANRNSGYTSFMQPGNSPDNYRTSYGSDSMGRNMVTAPKPGGPILKITEGGNLPKSFRSR